MADQENRRDASLLGEEDYHLLLEAVRLVPGLETAAQFTKLAMRNLTFPLNSPEDLRPLFDGAEGVVSGAKQQIPLSRLYQYLPTQMFPIASSQELISIALKPGPRPDTAETPDRDGSGAFVERDARAVHKDTAGEPYEQFHAEGEAAGPSTERFERELIPFRELGTEATEDIDGLDDGDGRSGYGNPNGGGEHGAHPALHAAAQFETDEAVRQGSEQHMQAVDSSDLPAPDQDDVNKPEWVPQPVQDGPQEPASRSTFSRPPTSGQRATSAEELDATSLLKSRSTAPRRGWRKLVYKVSGGLIKPVESAEARHRRELISRARTPVATGHHRVAVLSLKGGVGKTTTSFGLGATLAQVRGDRVIAVDANPDRGTLSDKVQLETPATVRDLLHEREQIKRYVDIRTLTSQAPSRLEILASDRDPSVSEAFTASDYQAVAEVLEQFYSICITDCGTGLLHSAMSGVLGLADQLVLVTSPAVDCARATSATLDWLITHHHERLVRSATVVLCSVRPRSKSTVDLDQLESHFAARCRAVVRIPYDPHLEEGAEIDLEKLHTRTRESFLLLAASVGDGFVGPQS
ncbi:MinD/ParA family protein [Nonomuraea sp. NPDC005501]|uniref:MinD/ParA family ATP-binding protein n=1 Tax=Nonomuraea sp. NPDC005501 TaxID=3156884 RepID=UPI0033B50266